MGCPSHSSSLSAFLDGELDSAQQRDLKNHLAGCGTCSQEFRDLETAYGIVETSLSPMSLNTEVWRAIEKEIDPSSKAPGENVVPFRARVLRWAALPIAAAAVFVFSLYLPTEEEVQIQRDFDTFYQVRQEMEREHAAPQRLQMDDFHERQVENPFRDVTYHPGVNPFDAE